MNKTKILFYVLCVLFIVWLPVSLQAATRRYHFDVPEQAVNKALNIFAQQAEQPVLFPFRRVKGIRTNRLNGEYTIVEAIEILLENTELQPMFGDNGVITIEVNSDRKIIEEEASMNKKKLSVGILAAVAPLSVGSDGLHAQESQPRGLEEVIVTAQKRSQSLQEVPISIEALGSEKLDSLNVQSFQDYVKILPTVSSEPSSRQGAGNAAVYMRGIATGSSGATGSLPSVGMYLDEQPITTVEGNVDVHLYDIARVEALAGPQGTLYGASSQSGTVRVITNAPDTSEFSSSVSIEANVVDEDDTGHLLEGYVNIPLSDTAAVRLVAWKGRDAGYVDNVQGTRTFPGYASTTADDITIDNSNIAEDNYNTTDTVGGRAALKIDLNDSWTVTTSVIAQQQESDGFFADDLSTLLVDGDNDVTHFRPEFSDNEFYQLGLTIEGSIGMFDVLYSANYLDRQNDGSFDYSDYSYFYDVAYSGSGFYSDLHFGNAGTPVVPNQFSSTAGARIMPGAHFTNDDRLTKKSQELRISSPQENRLRGVVGLFWQEQLHDQFQSFKMEGLADEMLLNRDELSGNTFPDTLYLNSMDRVDKDKAVFASLSYDLRDDLEVTVGGRYFEPEVTVKGFNGFSQGFNDAGWSGTGETACISQAQVGSDTPCVNVIKGISESGFVGRANLTWQVSDDHLLYATWSEGYRPGGINRDPTAGEFKSDFLTNWELGWKTEWLDNTLQFNGAVFLGQWDDIQVSFRGDNAIRQIDNGTEAEVKGLEVQSLWLPTENWVLSASASFYDAELTGDYSDFNEDGSVRDIKAPAGTRLPVTPKFKGNIVARYSFALGEFDAHLQSVVAHTGDRTTALDVSDNAIFGDVSSNTVFDISTGIRKNSYSLELFVKNVLNEDAVTLKTAGCGVETCGSQLQGIRVKPRTISIVYTMNF